MTLDPYLPELSGVRQRSHLWSFSPPISFPPKGFRAQFTYRECYDASGSYTGVWQRVAQLDFPDNVYVYRYLLEKRRRNYKVRTLEDVIIGLKAFFSFLRSVGKKGNKIP